MNFVEGRIRLGPYLDLLTINLLVTMGRRMVTRSISVLAILYDIIDHKSYSTRLFSEHLISVFTLSAWLNQRFFFVFPMRLYIQVVFVRVVSINVASGCLTAIRFAWLCDGNMKGFHDVKLRQWSRLEQYRALNDCIY